MTRFFSTRYIKPALAGASLLCSLSGCVAYDGGGYGYGYTSAYDAYPYAYYGGTSYYPRARDYHRGYNWGAFHAAPNDHQPHAVTAREDHSVARGHAGAVHGHR